MSQSVFAIANTYAQSSDIVTRLQNAGFPVSEISVLMPETDGHHDIGHVKATKMPEGAATGAAAGGVTGGVIGLLAGIGALAIPGVGPLIAAGPIMAALSGAAIGATTGGLVGGLVGLGIPELEAKRYEERLLSGNYVLAVRVNNHQDRDRAKEIFEDAGAEEIFVSSDAAVPDRS